MIIINIKKMVPVQISKSLTVQFIGDRMRKYVAYTFVDLHLTLSFRFHVDSCIDIVSAIWLVSNVELLLIAPIIFRTHLRQKGVFLIKLI